MEERRERTKRMRAAAGTQSNEEDAASQGSAGVGAAAASAMIAAATETDGEGTSIVAAAAEPEAVGSAETEEHIQRILLAIDNFTRKVSEMLESGRAMFKDLAADFEDRLCTERVERWEEEIRELRARDAANEQTRAVIHNAQLQLFHVRD